MRLSIHSIEPEEVRTLADKNLAKTRRMLDISSSSTRMEQKGGKRYRFRLTQLVLANRRTSAEWFTRLEASLQQSPLLEPLPLKPLPFGGRSLLFSKSLLHTEKSTSRKVLHSATYRFSSLTFTIQIEFPSRKETNFRCPIDNSPLQRCFRKWT